MSKTGTSAMLEQRFVELVSSNYTQYCERYNLPKNEAQFLAFLRDEHIIDIVHVKRYTVAHEYLRGEMHPKFSKTAVVRDLARRFQMAERSVWEILKLRRQDQCQSPAQDQTMKDTQKTNS
jgi:hypothetical protein